MSFLFFKSSKTSLIFKCDQASVTVYVPVTSNGSVCVLQVNQQAAKCIPSMVCPELTEQIRREIAASLHQRKGDFACYFLTDPVTFTLPAGTPHILRSKSLCFWSFLHVFNPLSV